VSGSLVAAPPVAERRPALRVLFDHQAFEMQPWGGISRYFHELIANFSGAVGVDLALARSRNEHVPSLTRLLGLPVTDQGFPETFLGGAQFLGRKQLRSVVKALYPAADARRVNRRTALARLRAGAYDLFHPTYYDPYFLQALGDRPFVLTVHDLTHEVYASHFSDRDRTRHYKRELGRRARRIIAVSAHTRADVTRLLDVDPAKVDVIHHGFSPPDSPAAEPPGLPDRYVLYTGTREGYKNWGAFAAALAPLLRDHDGLHIVCTGAPLSEAERGHLARLRIDDRVRHVHVGERTLPAVYARAAVFAFPSLYEGFGFPVLEAFAARCPAALSNRSALPEVGGDAAVYFDPEDADSIRAAVGRLLSDGALRQSLVARGHARLESFRWENTCAATLETYRRALAA
jgi:glycosyltransferase involved in cell wall biosynthesis